MPKQRDARRWILAGIVAGAAIVGPAGQAAEDPAALIEYRKSIMTAFTGHIGAIALVAKGEIGFTDEVAGHAHAINEMSKTLTRLFPEGSGKEAGETRALPVIWEKWDDFTAAAKRLGEESAKLAEVAESGDRAAIARQTGALGNDGCGGCHKTFREKKE